MEHGEARDERRIAQVGEVLAELRRRKQTFVDDLRRGRADQHRAGQIAHGAPHELAHDAHALAHVARTHVDQQLFVRRCGAAGVFAEHVRVDQRHAPAQRRDVGEAHSGLDLRARVGGIVEIARQEQTHGAEVTLGNANVVERQLFEVERARRLDQKSGAVAGASVGRAGATVGHRRRRFERHANDVVGCEMREVG